MLTVTKAYKTSKGIFWSKEDADKKQNRSKDHGNRPGDPVTYEPVQEVFVLTTGISDQIFELSKVEVK